MRRLRSCSALQIGLLALGWPAAWIGVAVACFAYVVWAGDIHVDPSLIGLWDGPAMRWMPALFLFAPPVALIFAWYVARRTV
jgi:hypothetical protein